MSVKVMQGNSPVFLLFLVRVSTMTSLIIEVLVLVCCASWSYDSVALAEAQPIRQPHVTATTTQASAPSTVSQAAPTKQTASQPIVTAKVTAQTETKPTTCQANASYSARPSITANGEGLHITHDPVYYYTVGGATRAQISDQIAQCGPSGEFAGDASYSLDWSYAFGSNEPDGPCTVKSVKVALRTEIILPLWQQSEASASVRNQMQVFTSSLAVHEYGHRTIAENYATKLYEQLQAYPPTDCTVIAEPAKAMARSIVTDLATAEAVYDMTNDHGRLQGATF